MPTQISGTTGVNLIQDGTVSQADLATGVGGTGPAFIAVPSASTSLISATDTKVLFATEQLDTANCYDTTLSRFTPNVAGLYWIGGAVRVTTTATSIVLYLYKNGAQHREIGLTAQGFNQNNSGATLVQMNGTTDYVEFFANQGAATQNSTNSVVTCWFMGYLVRAA